MNKLLYALLTGIILGDIATTEYGIRKTVADETNPIMRKPKVRALLWGITTPMPALLYYLRKLSGYKWLDWAVGGIAILRGGIVINNIIQLIRTKKLNK